MIVSRAVILLIALAALPVPLLPGYICGLAKGSPLPLSAPARLAVPPNSYILLRCGEARVAEMDMARGTPAPLHEDGWTEGRKEGREDT